LKAVKRPDGHAAAHIPHWTHRLSFESWNRRSDPVLVPVEFGIGSFTLKMNLDLSVSGHYHRRINGFA